MSPCATASTATATVDSTSSPTRWPTRSPRVRSWVLHRRGHRRPVRRRHLGRPCRPRQDDAMAPRHHRELLVLHQDPHRVGGSDPRRPRTARPQSRRRRLLAGVRGEWQARHRDSASACPHIRGVRLGGAVRPRGHVRLGAFDRPPGGPGAVVAPRHGVGVLRAQLRPPHRRGDPPRHRQVAQGVRP